MPTLSADLNVEADHDAPRVLAPDAVPAARLPDLLHRSGECRLRRAADEQGGRHRSEDLRPRRRHLLHRLFHPRSAEQPGAGTVRRAHLDRAHHDHLGHRLGGLRADRRTDLVPGAALSARRRGGRLLPGRDPLHHLLVPGALSRDHRRHLHGGDSGGRPDRLADLGRDPLHGRRARPRRLAVDLPARGGAGRAAGRGVLRLADRPAGARVVAGAPATAMADRQAGGRTPPCAARLA